jgi:hypothetical protein
MANSFKQPESLSHKNKESKFPIGCLCMSLGFLVCGIFFLWAFFSSTTKIRTGNPFMLLIFGAAWLLIGLIGLAALLLPLLKRR